MPDWNPEKYLQFRNERTQPSIDLVSRIQLDAPARIIDVGCGPGNSTQILAQRWPRSSITGLDYSAAMIEKARTDYPGQTWVQGDAAELDRSIKYDLVFSNAALQWMPNHETLVPGLWDMVAPNGALAVQIPRFEEMPASQALRSAANSGKWITLTRNTAALKSYHPIGFYYDILSKFTSRLDMWETRYIHVFPSLQGITDFMHSTAMRPYLDKLPSEENRKIFETEVLEACGEYYSPRSNGSVLFPFHRMFFVAYKEG